MSIFRWKHNPEEAAKIKSAVYAYEKCSDSFGNIKKLLQILSTMPVTTMEAERLFSEVQSTLTAVRATMTEQRMESLVLLQVYRNMLPTTNQVLERYAKKNRRLIFSKQIFQSQREYNIGDEDKALIT